MKSYIIKTSLLSSFILFGYSYSFAQEKRDAILMTIANSKVTVGEFENVYIN